MFPEEADNDEKITKLHDISFCSNGNFLMNYLLSEVDLTNCESNETNR